ncbi:hypothetical protein NDU88_000049 [Pleurodeles waltl]|uniref:Uncharacterized protein n=1 Tax=Pleurodeles waltl TaxID=8319 RepID=A0AAV7KLZ8_PLEWA|nr:hypothetical protein NDU88_000049 [Pleurodeles waltl]
MALAGGNIFAAKLRRRSFASKSINMAQSVPKEAAILPTRGVLNWIHASHTKRVTCPTDEELEVSKTTAAKKEVSGPESVQRGTETEGEPTEGGSVTQSEFQRGDSEPISAEVTGEQTQREVLPEADGFRFEVEPVTDPEGEGEEAEGGQGELTPPEPVAGPSRENTIVQEEGTDQRSEKPSKKKTHKGDNWPKPQAAIEKMIPGDTIEEEVDTTRKEDLSVGELQSERRLKKKKSCKQKPTLTFGTAYAHRNNLTCLLTPVEKSFLDHTDDRRKALKERLEKGLEKHTHAHDYAYTAIKAQGKLAIDALHSKWTFMLNGQDPAIPGIYYICGLNAYYRLPKGWYGTCYLGIVFPKIYQIDDLKQIPKMSELQHTRQKRETAAAVVGDIFGAIIPSVGVILNSIKIRKFSTLVDNMLTNFTGAILLMDTELAAERAMTLQNRLALDILLAKSGGVCKMLNERHCCAFIPDNGKKIRDCPFTLYLLMREVAPFLPELNPDGESTDVLRTKTEPEC